jgi:hypothetical protein
LAREAETIARRSAGPHERAEALAAVAQSLAAVGLQERALEVARQAEAEASLIRVPKSRAQALAAVAQSLAALGLYDNAEILARSITEAEWQVQALTEVATILANKGCTSRAQYLIALALSVGPCIVPLRKFLLPPDALIAAADMLSRSCVLIPTGG